MDPFWKTAKFWFLAAIAVGFSVLVLVIRGLLQRPTDPIAPEDPGFGGLPPAPAGIQQAANQAHEDVVAVKATTLAVSESQKAQLAEIAKMQDKRARRAALADFVQTSTPVTP